MKFFYSLKNIPLSVFSFFILLTLTTSCTKENNEITPVVPPIETMVMEFDDSLTGGKTSFSSNENHNLAALQIGVWNIILTVNLAVPVLAFSAITNETPNFQEGTWIWDKDFNIGVIGHNARLEGTVVGNSVQWEMYVSKDNTYSNFLWFTGTSALDGQSGQWLLNFNPNNSQPILQIDWEKETGGTTQIRYTNINANDSNTGDYIEYGIDESEGLNAFYSIYRAQEGFMIDIEWNLSSKEGRIRNPNYFADNEWYCWSSSFQNVDCE